MMSDKPSLSGMPPRQKVTAVLVVVMLVVVIWQLMKLFTGGKAPAPKPPAATASTAPGMANPAPAAPQTASVVAPAPQTPATQQPAQSSSISSEVMKMQQEMQEKYIRSLNDLQMLRIQKDIAETNQAIVASKLATVTAEKNISDLLTGPPVPKSPSGFAPTMVGGGAPPPTLGSGVNVGPPPGAVSVIEYSVVSVAMQQGRWFAVLSSQGKLFTVSVGDVLPFDGAVVVAIDRSGVIIEKEGEKKKISMLSSG